MKRILFLDRDGTIIVEPASDKQVDSVEKFAFIDSAISTLKRIASELEYDLVLITNQDGLGTESFPTEHFEPLQSLMTRTLVSEGIIFRDVLIDGSFPEQGLATRKPGLGLVQPYLSGEYDIENSIVIGDRITDMQFAKNLGCRGILFGANAAEDGAEKNFKNAANWPEAFALLKGSDRASYRVRKTKETNISISIDLDTPGNIQIATGLGFLDHMLTLLAFHGGFSLKLSAIGDLHVDEHHTVEDCAIILGEALTDALGKRKGTERYGFVLPMDEAEATVSLDLSGRSFLKWEAVFLRERVGDVPTELFEHFFFSFVNAAKITVHIRAAGKNDHHIIESIFKGVGRSLRLGMNRENMQNGGMVGIPSSKGIL